MIKSAFIILILITLGSSSYENDCLLENYHLPEPVRTEGIASRSLTPELVIISLSISTLEDQASLSLSKNQQIVSDTIKLLKKGHEITDEELSTTGLSIHPEYQNVYKQETQSWDQIFKGYRVQNSIQIRTTKLDQAGGMIDSCIRMGVTQVDDIQFDATAATKKDIKDQLIRDAVIDAKTKTLLALEPLGYEIIGIKSLEIENNNVPTYQRQQQYAQADSMSANEIPTQVFASKLSLSTRVTVRFLIQKKK